MSDTIAKRSPIIVNARNTVLAAIDKALGFDAANPAEVVPVETLNGTEFIQTMSKQIREQAEIAQRAANAEADRLNGLVGNLELSRTNIRKARRQFAEVGEFLEEVNIQGVEDEICRQIVTRWDAPEAIRAQLLEHLGYIFVRRQYAEAIGRINAEELAAQEKEWANLLRENRKDFERLGLLTPEELNIAKGK